MSLPLIAATLPCAPANATSIRIAVTVPSLLRDPWTRIAVPVVSALRSIVLPARKYYVLLVVLMVTAVPSTRLAAMLSLATLVIVNAPAPLPGP